MATRGEFSSQLGFIAAAAGSAVGLGNIWGFPFEAGQGGGGAFVMIYLTFCFILCFPVILRLLLVEKTEKNPVGAFTALGYEKWNWVGKMGVLAGILISFYNAVLVELSVISLKWPQPTLPLLTNLENTQHRFLKLRLWIIIHVDHKPCRIKGISGGIEKAAKLLMPALIIMILTMVIYSLLPNAIDGIKFYLIPDFSKINGSVVYNAMGQAFFHFPWEWVPL